MTLAGVRTGQPGVACSWDPGLDSCPFVLRGAGRRLCLGKTGRRARSFSFLGRPAEDLGPLVGSALGCATWHTPPNR
jgi:hypothetical protein